MVSISVKTVVREHINRYAREHKKRIYSAFGVLLIAMLVGAIIMNGNTVYGAENVVTISVTDASGVSVSLTSWKGSGNKLTLTPQGDVAAITLTFDHKYKDFLGAVNALDIDFRSVHPVVGSTADVAKVWLTDGSDTVEIGIVDLRNGKETIMLDKDKLEVLDDFASIQLIVKFYDSSSGNLTNYIAGNAESTIIFGFKTIIDTSSVGAFFASSFMCAMAAVRRLSAGISGVATSAAAAVFTNSAIVTIAMGMAALFVAMYYTGATKKMKKYF